MERLVLESAQWGTSLGQLLIGGLAAYVAYKYAHRHWLLRKLRIARISAEELKQLMDDGRDVLVVDLRGALDHEADPRSIPGALRLTAEELDRRHHEIPRDRDVILFCACPNEATAARLALMLRRKGIHRVRPLAGGIDGWRERSFPLEARRPAEEPVGSLPV